MVRRSCGGCCCDVGRSCRSRVLISFFLLHLACRHTEHHTGTDHVFELEKITFHVDGEHTYNGVKPAMEMHLVRVSTLLFFLPLLSQKRIF